MRFPPLIDLNEAKESIKVDRAKSKYTMSFLGFKARKGLSLKPRSLKLSG